MAGILPCKGQKLEDTEQQSKAFVLPLNTKTKKLKRYGKETITYHNKHADLHTVLHNTL